ncbi:MAG: 4-alpha-glucanotransferase [Polyangiaceae bacterium]|nr:4-alpha-glucanotransferase [Polyangiaceae bacterium]
MLHEARRAGVLAHLTSLPGPVDHGDLGPPALKFVDWLKRAGQTWWQMLPVVPPGYGGSPYGSPSTFAGSPALVSLELLRSDGLLRRSELVPPLSGRQRAGIELRQTRLALACERLRAGHAPHLTRELERFRAEQASWLRDYCLYAALKRAHGGLSWVDWDEPIARRRAPALERASRELTREIDEHAMVQFFFQRQWSALRAHAHAAGVRLLGDMPMFVAHDGVDAWANPEQFFLRKDGRPSVVAGVPPDDFSETGQLWGNPLFRWEKMKQNGFGWWLARLARSLELFDAVRLDHFIGFHRYWEVPADAKTAMHGRFVLVPGRELLEATRARFGGLPFLAEDLGVVTDDVVALRRSFGLPGMKVLHFAFSDPNGSDYLPHRYDEHAVVYTGTHDNDTTVGWFRGLPGGRDGERARVLRYTAGSPKTIHFDLIRLAYASVAKLAIIPLQDVLGLDSRARMNTPGTSQGNWSWRAKPGQLTPPLAAELQQLARTYERTP